MRHKVCDSCLDTNLLRITRQAIRTTLAYRAKIRIGNDADEKTARNDGGARSTDPFDLYVCDRFMRTIAMGAIGFEPT